MGILRTREDKERHMHRISNSGGSSDCTVEDTCCRRGCVLGELDDQEAKGVIDEGD